jgi:hypothetical protein
MLELRKVGFDWKEIATLLKITDCAARAEFSREPTRARIKKTSKDPNLNHFEIS